MKSLRARLFWSAGAATLVVWGIAVVASYQGTRHEAIEFLDGQLAQSARLLLSQIRHEMEDLHEGDGEVLWEDGLVERIETRPLHGYEQPLEFQVWALDGQGKGHLVLQSPHAPSLGFHARPGYAEITHDGQEWRILNQRDGDQRFQVQVAQPTGKRSQAALEVALRVLAPFTLALPLLALLLFIAVGRGLRPLERLAADVKARAPDTLVPLPTGAMPQEVLPLVYALNTLLERLGRALDNERRFTADAAHELRTPLAALQVQAQVARMAQDETTRNHAVDQVLAGVTRATHLMEQLLRLARLDPMASVANATPCPLAPLAEQVAEPLRHLARTRDIALDIRVPGDLALRADADLLGLALRNLLENALRHGSEATRVEVGADVGADAGVNAAPQVTRLWVKDDGSGVPQEELARLTERFYRGREVTTEGSGLGLAIVQRIAQLHGGELRLENLSGGGFQAMLLFPSSLSVR